MTLGKGRRVAIAMEDAHRVVNDVNDRMNRPGLRKLQMVHSKRGVKKSGDVGC